MTARYNVWIHMDMSEEKGKTSNFLARSSNIERLRSGAPIILFLLTRLYIYKEKACVLWLRLCSDTKPESLPPGGLHTFFSMCLLENNSKLKLFWSLFKRHMSLTLRAVSSIDCCIANTCTLVRFFPLRTVFCLLLLQLYNSFNAFVMCVR